ncbi:MAG: hypothetical protein R2748_10470 [Bryobacterales bacterium]
MMTNSAQVRRRSLESMAEAYGKSAEIARAKQSVDLAYPLLNWYGAQIALGWCPP